MRSEVKTNMARIVEKSFFFVCFCAFYEAVSAYYCDNDKCLEEEFCCGENICCVSYKVWELWYFWCGILFCLFLLSLCACFWRERQRAYWVFHSPIPYRPLGHEDNPKYNQDDPYESKERSLSPTFYNQALKQPSWYSTHPVNNMSAHQYSDNEQLYETGREPDY